MPVTALAWLPAADLDFEDAVRLGPAPGYGGGVRISIHPKIESFSSGKITVQSIAQQFTGGEIELSVRF